MRVFVTIAVLAIVIAGGAGLVWQYPTLLGYLHWFHGGILLIKIAIVALVGLVVAGRKFIVRGRSSSQPAVTGQ